MNAFTKSAATDSDLIQTWLSNFERALEAGDKNALKGAFAEDSHWRDLLAFTDSITPHEGPEAIVGRLCERQPAAGAANFLLAADRAPPRRVTRLGIPSIEAFFSFETRVGRGHGLLRLVAAEPEKAWAFMTSLEELKGHEEPVNERRPSGSAYSRNFGGDNWSDLRRAEQAFADREPAVVIVGAGQAGLSIAARLRLLGVDTLVIDKMARVGDVWRQRYHSLALHNQINLNHLPYLPWPQSWPTYLPKDMIAGWLETYAWATECNVWTETTLVSGEFDEAAGVWNARIRKADGSERVLHPRHLVFANGVAGRPVTPKLPGLDTFKGTLLHTHDFRSGADWKGKRALVVGAGTSGHDVAQDLQGHGAAVTLVQRGSATIASVKAAGLVHSVYYEEGLPLEDCDLIAAASTYPMLIRSYQAAVRKMKEIDRDLLAGLAARGFKLDYGEDETGHQMKFRRRHGGYYLNCGCSELIVDGEVGLLQHEEIDRFVEDGVLLKDGRVEKADLIVTATGYQNQQEVVRELLGDAIAERVGSIWGIAPDGELANMYRATPQKGLWFSGGGFAHARIYSRYVALQIKMHEIGLLN
uniref:NAD(P)/FAD-dependent oxidoreductase n=1 Tax=Bosea sp. NBC_00436 TaxID=2969620 RepID=A0A9E7ZU05_9HYPH